MNDYAIGSPVVGAQPTASQYHDFTGLKALKHSAHQDPDAAVEKVAKQFESIFIQMMLKGMRATVPKDSLFGSNQMDSYQDMADQQTALTMSETGGIGLAEVIKRQLTLNVGESDSATEMVMPGKVQSPDALTQQLKSQSD